MKEFGNDVVCYMPCKQSVRGYIGINPSVRLSITSSKQMNWCWWNFNSHSCRILCM